MKILSIIILLNLLTYACLIKLSDRIGEKQQLPISKTQIKVDKAMQDYYQKPVNFKALNKLSSAELDIIIQKAGF